MTRINSIGNLSGGGPSVDLDVKTLRLHGC